MTVGLKLVFFFPLTKIQVLLRFTHHSRSIWWTHFTLPLLFFRLCSSWLPWRRKAKQGREGGRWQKSCCLPWQTDTSKDRHGETGNTVYHRHCFVRYSSKNNFLSLARGSKECFKWKGLFTALFYKFHVKLCCCFFCTRMQQIHNVSKRFMCSVQYFVIIIRVVKIAGDTLYETKWLVICYTSC